MVKGEWGQDPWVKTWFVENTVAKAPASGPIFVIAGEADPSAPIGGVRNGGARACRNHKAVFCRSYRGLIITRP